MADKIYSESLGIERWQSCQEKINDEPSHWNGLLFSKRRVTGVTSTWIATRGDDKHGVTNSKIIALHKQTLLCKRKPLPQYTMPTHILHQQDWAAFVLFFIYHYLIEVQVISLVIWGKYCIFLHPSCKHWTGILVNKRIVLASVYIYFFSSTKWVSYGWSLLIH